MALWMMGEHEVLALHDRYEKAQSSGQKPMAMQDSIVRGESFNILQMRGPLIARSDFITEMLGLKTTEQLMEDFQALVAEGKPIGLDIDGPGGQVPLVFEFADMIHDAGELVTAYTGGSAASAHMALFQAANTRLAHDTATLGSIGVISYVPYKFGDEVVSSNAKNKIPSQERQQARVDELEAIFHERISLYTGMDQLDIVSKGEEGGTFTGQSALEKGFVDSLSNSQEAFKTNTNDSSNSDETSSMTEEEHLAALAANNERWELLLSHENATNIEAVKTIAVMPIDDNAALAMMEHVAAKAAAPDTEQPATPKDDQPAPVASVDPNDVANAIAEGLRTAMASGQIVKAPIDNEEDTDNDDKPVVSDMQKGEAFALSMLNRGKR